MEFKGIITALITPFYQGELDKKSFVQLLQDQLLAGVDGFVINGTTGESPTLTPQEVSQLMEITMGEVSGQVPIILGIGHYNTQQALKNLNQAQKFKASACLAVTPYYNKPSQQGLLKHFKKLAHQSPLPILLYHVPSRTQVSLEIPTLVELSSQKQIVGIKEASGDMDFADQLFSQLPSDFRVLSGDDFSFLKLAQKGGQGVISVCSHFLLKAMKQALSNVFQNQPQNFEEKYFSILQTLYKVSNPMMIKQVLYLQNRIKSPELRLPLCEPENILIQELKKQLQELGL